MLKPYQNKDNIVLPLRIIPVLENNENLVLCPWCLGKGKLVVVFSGKPDWTRERIRCGNCDGVGAVEATWTEKIVYNLKEG